MRSRLEAQQHLRAAARSERYLDVTFRPVGAADVGGLSALEEETEVQRFRSADAQERRLSASECAARSDFDDQIVESPFTVRSPSERSRAVPK